MGAFGTGPDGRGVRTRAETATSVTVCASLRREKAALAGRAGPRIVKPMPREPQNGENADRKPPVSARDQRLKAALRENLRRRKAQARGRAESAAPDPESGPSDEEGR